MADKTNEETENGDGIELSSRFLTLLMVGFAVLIAGISLLVFAFLMGGGSASVGGVIFIGPFPIVFGAGSDAIWLVAIGMLIAIAMIIGFILIRRRE